jgi:hypothetical protein
MMVKRQLQSMSIVPRVSLDKTKLTDVDGAVQFVWKVVYACAKAMKLQRTARLRAIVVEVVERQSYIAMMRKHLLRIGELRFLKDVSRIVESKKLWNRFS